MNNRKIAVYCRVSTDDQADNGYNLREQEKRCDQYIVVYSDEFPEEVVKYIDDGFSAKDLKRREMSMLLDDIQQGLISKVVVHNLDRLTRSMKDLIYLIELFEKYDVQLYSLKERIDTDSAMGRFFVSMIILMAQWEREVISERTIRAMDQSAFEGNYVHGKPPFGYELVDKKLQIKNDEAIMVQEIYNQYYYSEYSINSIYHFLSSNHRNFGFMWTYDRVKNILTNEIYTGTYRNKRIKIESHSPSIIDGKLFYSTQDMLKHRNKRNRHTYLFRGKCYNVKGELLALDSTIKATRNYRYYVDRETTLRINEEVLDAEISILMDRHIDKMIRSTCERMIMNLKKKDNFLEELKYLYEVGVISIEYFYSETEKYKHSVDGIESQITDMINGVRYWKQLDLGEKLLLIKKSVNKITIDLKKQSIINVEFD